jgi:hypothetical protein
LDLNVISGSEPGEMARDESLEVVAEGYVMPRRNPRRWEAIARLENGTQPGKMMPTFIKIFCAGA